MCSDVERSDCDRASVLNPLISLTRTIHERFYCNREFAATTSLRRAGSPLATSTYCFKYASLSQGSACPSRNGLRNFATNRHE
jgi:hypothetical protein